VESGRGEFSEEKRGKEKHNKKGEQRRQGIRVSTAVGGRNDNRHDAKGEKKLRRCYSVCHLKKKGKRCEGKRCPAKKRIDFDEKSSS